MPRFRRSLSPAPLPPHRLLRPTYPPVERSPTPQQPPTRPANPSSRSYNSSKRVPRRASYPEHFYAPLPVPQYSHRLVTMHRFGSRPLLVAQRPPRTSWPRSHRNRLVAVVGCTCRWSHCGHFFPVGRHPHPHPLSPFRCCSGLISPSSRGKEAPLRAAQLDLSYIYMSARQLLVGLVQARAKLGAFAVGTRTVASAPFLLVHQPPKLLRTKVTPHNWE